MSKGSKTQQVNQVTSPWGPSQPYLTRALEDMAGLYDAGNLTPQPFGSRLAGESPYTTQARDQMANRAMGGNPVVQQSMDAFGSITNPYGDLDRVKEAALRQALPEAASYYQNAGMLNSSIAGEGMAEAATRAIAPIDYGAYESAQNRALSGLSLAPQMADLAYHDDQMLARAGASADARAQASLDDEAALYYETQDQPFQNVSRFSNAALGFGGAGGSTTGTQANSSQSGILGILGGLAKIGGTVAPLFSDRRLKKDARKIGETPSGTNIYTFKYKGGDGKTYVGPMADEVPEHIVGNPFGFALVDYEGAFK